MGTAQRQWDTKINDNGGALATGGPMPLHRPCPACGNSRPERCKPVYVIPEFEVLRCGDCELTFINRLVDDNFGFDLEYDLSADTLLVGKAVSDFRRLKSRLRAAGVSDFRSFRLLDVGCGIGTFLAGAQQEGWKVTGLELNPAAATYAAEKRKLRVVRGSIEGATGLASESFDVVTLFGVIEHLADPVAAIKQCARVLRPRGFLLLQTPTEDGLIRRAGRLLYWVTHGLVHFQVKQFYQMGGGHTLCFNRRSIGGLLDRCGFELLRIDGSTYGLRILLKRFERLSLLERFLKAGGTAVMFALGRIVGASNHMTIYAKKSIAAAVAR